MIHLRLSGGVGNQLFQYAAALRLAGLDHEKIQFYSGDLSKYKVARVFELDKVLNLSFAPANCYSSILLRTRLARLLSVNGFFVNDRNYIHQFKSHNKYLCFLDGYFQYEQSWDMISGSIDFIKRHLHPHLRPIKKQGLVVHARGGDFLDDNKSHVHLLKFYDDVIPQVKSKGYFDGKLICSDNKYGSVIKSFFESNGINLVFSDSTDECWTSDFVDMLSSSLLIGSRSTFCWWAAVLGDVPSMFPHDFSIGTKRVLFHPYEL